MTTKQPRRGRPALAEGEPSTSVHVRLAPASYDRLFQRARREDVSIPALVRRTLDELLDDDDED